MYQADSHYKNEIWSFEDPSISIQHVFLKPELYPQPPCLILLQKKNYSAKKPLIIHYFHVQLYQADFRYENEIWYLWDPSISTQHVFPMLEPGKRKRSAEVEAEAVA